MIYKEKRKNKIYILFLFSIIFINTSYIFIIFKTTIISNAKAKKEQIKIENYLEICNNKKLNKLKKYHKRKNPKVSIISPLFNREKYISRFLKSIYYQNFDDYEIIFVDDYSTDNSIKLLEKYQKNDQRILLIKNKKNKGMFINRNLGVLFSNGKYTILPDPDDLLAKNSLKNLFIFAHKYNYDLIRFNIYSRNKNLTFERIVDKLENRPIYQPELSTFIYYGINELERTDCYIHNKFIKRGVYIKAINSLNKFYLNMYMTFMEDSINVFFWFT